LLLATRLRKLPVAALVGAVHAGGNDTWYYTQGDVATPGLELGNAWGWMQARYVFTTHDQGDSRLSECPPL
jgi:hypothetical protein